MSDAELDIREQIVRIDRAIAETGRLQAETRKLTSEQLDKERWWFPWLQLLTLVISSAAIGAVVARLFH